MGQRGECLLWTNGRVGAVSFPRPEVGAWEGSLGKIRAKCESGRLWESQCRVGEEIAGRATDFAASCRVMFPGPRLVPLWLW
jgi:hypothetical protein